MAGFDDPGVYYSEPFFQEEVSEEGEVSRTAAVRRFKEFIKTFLDQENVYSYRLASAQLHCTPPSLSLSPLSLSVSASLPPSPPPPPTPESS